MYCFLKVKKMNDYNIENNKIYCKIFIKLKKQNKKYYEKVSDDILKL
jgi:hypothetical protein